MARAILLVGLDLGTSAVKAVLFDRRLRPLEVHRAALATLSGGDGRSEQDPSAVVRAARRTLAAALAGAEARGAHVAAIGLSAHRSSAVALDRATGRPATPLVLWNDRRATAVAARLARSRAGALLERASGLPLLPFFFAPRARWLAELPAARALARRGRLALVTADAFLLHELATVGELATDPSMAARTLLFDTAANDWSARLLAAAGLERSALAAVLPTVAPRGRVHGVPVLASAADQSAAVLGLAPPEAGAATLVLGTGAFAAATGSARRRGTFPLVLARIGGRTLCARECNDPSTGTSAAMVAALLGLGRGAAALDAVARGASADPPCLVPAASGLGAPWLRPAARAALFDLDPGTTRADVARATIAGVAARAAELLDAVAAPRRVVAAGGGAASDLLLQDVADLSGRTILRAAVTEASARGAALLAGLGAGAAAELGSPLLAPPIARRFAPKIGPSARRRRRAAFAAAVIALLAVRTFRAR